MKVELNIEKKYFFAILSTAVIFAAVIGVYAYGTSTPSVFGHTAEELAITLPNGSTSTLQQAITNNYIGGGGAVYNCFCSGDGAEILSSFNQTGKPCYQGTNYLWACTLQ